mmetsp:Transcript_10324/g.28758  ORF Transcript_10324/g.28758 Transcript_10324/m.28758 type:complete len:328 (-) Transcript_10324:73-1056(-)
MSLLDALRAAVIEAKGNAACSSQAQDEPPSLCATSCGSTLLDLSGSSLAASTCERTLLPASPDGSSSWAWARTPAGCGTPLREFAAGDRVLARFKASKRWYAATVESVGLDGSYGVKWEDGHQKDRCKQPNELVEVPGVEEAPRTYRRQDKVLARYRDVPELLREAYAHRYGPWYQATVREVRADGTYKIAWCDGDRKHLVKRPDELVPWTGGPRRRSRRRCPGSPSRPRTPSSAPGPPRVGGGSRGPVHLRLYEDSRRRAFAQEGNLVRVGGGSQRPASPPPPSQLASARGPARPVSARRAMRPASAGAVRLAASMGGTAWAEAAQ